MNRFISITAAFALTAGAAFAQTTTQEAVLGQSGNADFPLQIRGGNGVIYNCKNAIVVVEGVRARQCVGENGLFDAGNGLAAGVGAGIGALILVAIAGSNGSSTTTTTTPTGS